MNKIEQALRHTTDTKRLVIGPGCVRSSAGMFQDLFPGKKAIIVADRNTWEVAGKDVLLSLQEAGVPHDEPFIFTDPDLYAEWTYVEQLKARLSETDAIPIAVGSGVINDLTKYVAFLLGRRYMTVGTAASMDGYTAYGSSITIDGNKQTVDCPAPYGFVMDPVIAAEAPKELAASGYGDLIAKIPAGADWMLAEAAGVEAIDPLSWGLVQDGLRESLADPVAVREGDIDYTEKLSEGLLMSGFAMQAYRSSRPASGMEHQFSHCWDMENLCYQGKHVSHGFKVSIGTLASTASLEFLLEKGLEGLDVDACVASWKSWEETEDDIRRIFEGKPGHLSRALKETKDKYVDRDGLRKQLEALKAAWPVLSRKVREQIIPFGTLKENLRLVGAPFEPEMIGVSRERLRTTLRYIPYMRSRFTNIDVVFRCGMLPALDRKLFGKGGIWETNM
ncbi:MAG: sn-glycerol-1-phosphate dehydrogenase [Bacteroidales bacterium]|nr:sn-glycerol-1-phosphate dehydrogenase [Bacteroidales bacterium]